MRFQNCNWNRNLALVPYKSIVKNGLKAYDSRNEPNTHPIIESNGSHVLLWDGNAAVVGIRKEKAVWKEVHFA